MNEQTVVSSLSKKNYCSTCFKKGESLFVEKTLVHGCTSAAPRPTAVKDRSTLYSFHLQLMEMLVYVLAPIRLRQLPQVTASSEADLKAGAAPCRTKPTSMERSLCCAAWLANTSLRMRRKGSHWLRWSTAPFPPSCRPSW